MKSWLILLLFGASIGCTNTTSVKISGFTADGRKYELTPSGNDITYLYHEYYEDGGIFRKGEFQAMKKVGRWEEYYPDGDLLWEIENWIEEQQTGLGCATENISLDMEIFPKPENGVLKADTEYFLKPSFLNIQGSRVLTYCSGCERYVNIGNDSRGRWKLNISPDQIGGKLILTFEIHCFDHKLEPLSEVVLYNEEFLVE